MSHQWFGSQRAKLALSGAGAMSLVALLCAQWTFAELRRAREGPAASQPTLVAPNPATSAQPGRVTAQPDASPAKSPGQAPAGQSASSAHGQTHGSTRSASMPIGQGVGLVPAAPAGVASPNVDETAAIRTGPSLDQPNAASKIGEPNASQGREARERRAASSEKPARPAASEALRATAAAQVPGPSTPSSGEPLGGSTASRTPSMRAAGEPSGGPISPAPANESAERAGRGDLQAVVDQITNLRDDVRGVGDRITKLREDVRADISRLEIKVQSLEPRQAAAAPDRNLERGQSRVQGEGRIVGSEARTTLRAARGGSARLDETRRRVQTDAKPSRGDPEIDASRPTARALRRPSARDRRTAETSSAPKPLADSTRTGTVAPGIDKVGPGLSSRRRAATAATTPVRTTIRRSAGAARSAMRNRSIVRSAGAGPIGRRPVDLAIKPRRQSDQRYASFRTVQEISGPRQGFRNGRRSLRYRPIVECVP